MKCPFQICTLKRNTHHICVIQDADLSLFTFVIIVDIFSNLKLYLDDDGPPLSNTDVKNLVILTELPFVVSFAERVKVWHCCFVNSFFKDEKD